MSRIARPINLIVVHCSATPNGRWTTVEDIDSWHRDRGFHRDPAAVARFNPTLTSIGYHFVIYTNGASVSGRSLEEVGAHVQGYNQRSIGICMVGTDQFSPEQWAALDGLFGQLPSALYGYRTNMKRGEAVQMLKQSGVQIAGHRDMPNVHKECPGFNVSDWLASGPPPAAIFNGGQHAD